MNGWIAYFGIPSSVSREHGLHVESILWRQLIKLLGRKWIQTTSYHSTASGPLKIFHCQLKTDLKVHLNLTNVLGTLPMLLLGIHTALKDVLRFSVALRRTLLGCQAR